MAQALTRVRGGTGAPPCSAGAASGGGGLKRDVGLVGLVFVSLGSIIGSGWLLGAQTAAKAAGPASLVSWLLAGAIIVVLALVHAALGATYPVSGGTAVFPISSSAPSAASPPVGWRGSDR